jgi:hypothetical protein
MGNKKFKNFWENIELLRETRNVYKILGGDQFGVVHAMWDGIVLRVTELGCEDANSIWLAQIEEKCEFLE